MAALGRRCYHIGPARDDNMLEGIGLRPVAEIGEAEFILNTGPWGWDETGAIQATARATSSLPFPPQIREQPRPAVFVRESLVIVGFEGYHLTPLERLPRSG